MVNELIDILQSLQKRQKKPSPNKAVFAISVIQIDLKNFYNTSIIKQKSKIFYMFYRHKYSLNTVLTVF